VSKRGNPNMILGAPSVNPSGRPRGSMRTAFSGSCEWCGAWFLTQSNKKRFCSTRCYTQKWHAQHGPGLYTGNCEHCSEFFFASRNDMRHCLRCRETLNWNQLNRDRYVELRNANRERVAIRCREKRRRWREDNPVIPRPRMSHEEVLERARIRDRARSASRCEKRRQYKHAWYLANKERIKSKQLERQQTPEFQEWSRSYSHKRTALGNMIRKIEERNSP
jgi:hypothetical protein